ncbi:transcriptional regulatory protein protein, putative [Babesia ovis]|uniref:Transcriptional regulatory protein protein, putative n=1 Tax=Babesia ovis TaxID=5869 RepID=A0A9W5TF40_BABOV|nr:transcriptional regulatory protein protein, putative [Babesia ovis]
MATSGHTHGPSKAEVLAQLEEADNMTDEERVNKYFYNLYVANVTTDDIIDVMRRFEASPPESRNRKTYRTMLKILFNECRFFTKYPVQELAITAELFGKMIKNCLLLSNGNLLMLALRCILEALKRGKMSKMFQFGTIAVSQFENSIANYPWFSTALLEIPDVRETFPQLYKTCEKLQTIMTDDMRGTTYVDQAKGIIIRPDDCEPGSNKHAQNASENAGIGAQSAGNDKDRLDVGEMESLMNSVADDLSPEAPPVQVVNQIYAAFNNMSLDTAAQKASELNQAIDAGNLPWLLLYIIKTRASKEQNLHEVFVVFIENIKIPKVFDLAIQISYSCISACLKHILDHKELPSYRTLLKNLGSWLGRITLGRNIPIMSRHLDLKQVMFHAYENGAMIAALPFVCKTMEHINNSKIFKPPNPWTTAILNFLVEIHGLRGLKTSLIFEVEVLFKHLGLQMDMFAKKTQLLESRIKPDDSVDFDTSVIEPLGDDKPSESVAAKKPTEGPKNAGPILNNNVHLHLLRSTPHAGSREGGKDNVRDKLNMLLAKVMREGPGSVRSTGGGSAETRFGDVRSKDIGSTMHGGYHQDHIPAYLLNSFHNQPGSQISHLLTSPLPLSNDSQTQPLNDFAEHLLQKLHTTVVISPSIAIFEMQPQLRACVPVAIERAVRRVLPVVSDHAISIARATTRVLIANDFAGEEDESALRVAVSSMMEYFATSLVVATSKEPLRIAFHESLKMALQTYSTQDCNNQVLVEQLVQIISQDNIAPAVAVAEKIVGEQASREVDSVMADVIKICQMQQQHNPPITLPPLLQQWNKLNVCMDKRNLTLYRSLFQSGTRGIQPSGLQHASPRIPVSRTGGPHIQHQPSTQRTQHSGITTSGGSMAACNPVMSKFEECFAEVREPLRDIALFPPTLYSKNPTEPDYEPIMFSTHALLVLYSLPVDHDLFSCIAKCLNVMENSKHADVASLAIAHRLLTFLCEGLGAQAGLNVEVLLCVLDGLNQLNPSVKQSLAAVIFSQPLDRVNNVFNVVTVTGLLRYDLLDWSHLVHYLTLAMDKGRNIYAVEMAIVVTAIAVIDQRSVTPDAASVIIREIASIKCGQEMCETYAGVLLKDARAKLLKDYMEMQPEARRIIQSLTPILKRNLAACITANTQLRLWYPSNNTMPLPESIPRETKKSSHLNTESISQDTKILTESTSQDSNILKESISQDTVPLVVNPGFGGVRRVVPPPPVSESHRAIVSIIFAKWIECSLPYEGENLLLAWRQFFQRFNLQSLFKMDGGTDNFFAICVASAIGTLTASATADQLDQPNFPTENTDSLVALAKMADVMLRLVGGSEVPPTSALQKLLAATASLVLYDSNFVAYYKLWVVLLRYFDKFEASNGQVVCRITFLNGLRAINPTRAPEFCYFWLKLIRHPGLLPGTMSIPRCWPHLAQIFLEMTSFLNANQGNQQETGIDQLEAMWYDLVQHVVDTYPQFVMEYYFCIGGSARVERLASSCSNTACAPIGSIQVPIDHLPAMTVAPTVPPMVVNLLMRHGIKSYTDSVLRSALHQGRSGSVPNLVDSGLERLVKVIEDILQRDPGQCVTLITALVYYIGIEFYRSLPESERVDETRLYLYLELLRHLSVRGKHLFVAGICRHLRFPNMHTHFFSCLLLWLYDELRSPREEMLRQIILRVLLEQSLSPVECPWGVKLTVVELFRNPRYKLGSDSFKSIPSRTRSLIDAVAQACSDM